MKAAMEFSRGAQCGAALTIVANHVLRWLDGRGGRAPVGQTDRAVVCTTVRRAKLDCIWRTPGKRAR